jgi:hypothetical protein
MGFRNNNSVRNLIFPIPAVRGAEIPGTMSSGRPNFVRCSLTFAGLQYKTAWCHSSGVSNFEVAPRVFENLSAPEGLCSCQDPP